MNVQDEESSGRPSVMTNRLKARIEAKFKKIDISPLLIGCTSFLLKFNILIDKSFTTFDKKYNNVVSVLQWQLEVSSTLGGEETMGDWDTAAAKTSIFLPLSSASKVEQQYFKI